MVGILLAGWFVLGSWVSAGCVFDCLLCVVGVWFALRDLSFAGGFCLILVIIDA